MSVSLGPSPAPDALLKLARDHSPGEELKCHTLIGLMQTCHALDQALRSELASSGLTETGFQLLSGIIRRAPDETTPTDLATTFHLSRQSISITLGRLEISGLITRERNLLNRRMITVRATDSGREAYNKALTHYLASITRFMSVLKTKDITLLDQACARLRQFSTEAPAL